MPRATLKPLRKCSTPLGPRPPISALGRAQVAYAERAEAGAEDAQLEAKLREVRASPWGIGVWERQCPDGQIRLYQCVKECGKLLSGVFEVF